MSYYRPSTSTELAYYPVRPELRCNCHKKTDKKWAQTGCQYRAHYLADKPQIACKNGKPYDCNCNLIQEPYSMAYEGKRHHGCAGSAAQQTPQCKQGPGVWYSRAPHFLN